MRMGCWNVSSWKSKDEEIIITLHKHKIDICIISEIEFANP